MEYLSDTKPPWLSLGIVGGLLAVVAGLAGLAGTLTDDPAQEQALGAVPLASDLYLYVLSIVGGLLSVYGRITATKRIGWS